MPSPLEQMLRRLPRITDIERAAFGAQFSDARCSALGIQTKSAGVLTDAAAFANVIDATLAKNYPALRRYSRARFAWFLECVLALREARDAQETRRSGVGATRRSFDQAVARATEMRHELLGALEMLATDHTTDAEALVRARGTADKPAQLLASLNEIARLADGWLRRDDKESRALVASVDLHRGDVDAAWAAAQTLEREMEAASGKRRKPTQDDAAVNRIEGRVLAEMQYARRAFADARGKDARVPPLNPGKATRRAIAGHGAHTDAGEGIRARRARTKT